MVLLLLWWFKEVQVKKEIRKRSLQCVLQEQEQEENDGERLC